MTRLSYYDPPTTSVIFRLKVHTENGEQKRFAKNDVILPLNCLQPYECSLSACARVHFPTLKHFHGLPAEPGLSTAVSFGPVRRSTNSMAAAAASAAMTKKKQIMKTSLWKLPTASSQKRSVILVFVVTTYRFLDLWE